MRAPSRNDFEEVLEVRSSKACGAKMLVRLKKRDELTSSFYRGSFKLTQEQIAEKVGRSRAAVANSLRLLGLPGEVQSWVADNRLSVGHAKAILGLANPAEQRLVAERVLKRNLTVRETEQLVEQLKGEAKVRARTLGGAAKSTHVLAVEERLQQKLGTHVSRSATAQAEGGSHRDPFSITETMTSSLRLLGVLSVDNL